MDLKLLVWRRVLWPPLRLSTPARQPSPHTFAPPPDFMTFVHTVLCSPATQTHDVRRPCAGPSLTSSQNQLLKVGQHALFPLKAPPLFLSLTTHLINMTALHVGIANSGYTHRKRELVGLTDEIRSSGAQLVVDLSRIAGIGQFKSISCSPAAVFSRRHLFPGDQSVGKSSLIEAISAVRFLTRKATVVHNFNTSTLKFNMDSFSMLTS